MAFSLSLPNCIQRSVSDRQVAAAESGAVFLGSSSRPRYSSFRLATIGFCIHFNRNFLRKPSLFA